MIKIKFRYRDSLSYPRWNTGECIVSSPQECIDFYGLKNWEYEILEVEMNHNIEEELKEEYEKYVKAGGTLSFDDWFKERYGE